MEIRNNNKTDVSMFRSIDWITIILYFSLVIMGAISIYAATYDFDNASMFDFNEFSGKQFTWIGLSLIIGCGILLIDYTKLTPTPFISDCFSFCLSQYLLLPTSKGLILGLYSDR